MFQTTALTYNMPLLEGSKLQIPYQFHSEYAIVLVLVVLLLTVLCIHRFKVIITVV